MYLPFLWEIHEHKSKKNPMTGVLVKSRAFNLSEEECRDYVGLK